MKLGAAFPQTAIGSDPVAVKAYAQAVEAMGFDYLLAYDHVLEPILARYERTGVRRHFRTDAAFANRQVTHREVGLSPASLSFCRSPGWIEQPLAP